VLFVSGLGRNDARNSANMMPSGIQLFRLPAANRAAFSLPQRKDHTMEKWQAYWPDGRLYQAASDGKSTWDWHAADEIARVIGGTAKPIR
jgi:hypothetical protein